MTSLAKDPVSTIAGSINLEGTIKSSGTAGMKEPSELNWSLMTAYAWYGAVPLTLSTRK